MTRNEFIEDVTTWYDLRSFCDDNRLYDFFEDIYSEEERDEVIDERLDDYARDYTWYDLRDWLSDIPTGYDYYKCNGVLDWEPLDRSDFEDIKDSVIDRMDQDYAWDDEEDDEFIEDENEDDTIPIIEDDAYPEEDISIEDLISVCSLVF